MRIAGRLAAAVFGLASLSATAARADLVLYGGNGNAGLTPGGLVTIDQTTGAGTLVGDPVTPGGLSGIAFNAAGQLFGSTVGAGNNSLVLINPDTGALTSTIGPLITSTGAAISIGDLSFQPGSGTLFGIGSNNTGGGGNLYTIDTATGLATLIGATGSQAGGGLAFTPGGTLYFSGYDASARTALNTLDPTTGAILSSVSLDNFYEGLGVRPTDGVLFATRAGSNGVFTIDPTTGISTLLGLTGTGHASDLDFRVRSVPEPASILLSSLGGLVLLGHRLSAAKRRRQAV